MMSVPSTGWSVALCCCRPLRSSAQPWGMEKSRVSGSPSDLACLDTGNRIMRAVIHLARQCHRFNVPWAIENPEKSFCWMTSQLEELSQMHNVHKMTMRKTYPTKLAGRPSNLLLGPPSPPECREHAMIWACNGRVFFAQSPSHDIRAASLSSRRDPAKA